MAVLLSRRHTLTTHGRPRSSTDLHRRRPGDPTAGAACAGRPRRRAALHPGRHRRRRPDRHSAARRSCLASSLLLIGHAVFIFLAYGTTSAVARLLGAAKRRAAHQAVQSLWLAALVGFGLLGIGLVAGPTLIGAMGGRGAVATNAEVYLRISLFGVPAMLIGLAGVGYLRGLQDTARPFYVALGSAVLNLALELVLVYGFDQGIGVGARHGRRASGRPPPCSSPGPARRWPATASPSTPTARRSAPSPATGSTCSCAPSRLRRAHDHPRRGGADRRRRPGRPSDRLRDLEPPGSDTRRRGHRRRP
ncbi:MAG: MATE family efflux transporter [Acidimicrobiales bacterium]